MKKFKRIDIDEFSSVYLIKYSGRKFLVGLWVIEGSAGFDILQDVDVISYDGIDPIAVTWDPPSKNSSLSNFLEGLLPKNKFDSKEQLELFLESKGVEFLG